MQALRCRLTGSATFGLIVCSAVLSLVLLTAFGVSAAADHKSLPLHHSDTSLLLPVAASSTGPWYIQRIDRPAVGFGSDRGKHVSIAIRSTQTFISYYDATDTSLRVAYKAGSGGNCGPSNTWWCEVIDNSGNVGQWSSIAATPSGKTLFGIAYYDATNHDLKFATYSCVWGPCIPSPQTVMTEPFGLAGMYASAKYDSNGVAHIAFLAATIGSSVLGYAHSVPSGGNCGVGPVAGKWQCEGVEAGAGIGQYASLDLDNSNQPHIAYYDADTKHLKYASYVGGGTGNCGAGAGTGNWQCDTIDDVGDVGRFASLRVAKNISGTSYIAYYDSTNGKLKLATQTGPGGNCGPLIDSSRTWMCNAIAGMGPGLTQAGIALELVGANEPVVSYMYAADPIGHSALNIARATRRMSGVTYPFNCGPSTGTFVWWCETIDGGGSWTGEASYVTMAADYQGRLRIAYCESDDFYSTGYVKLAEQALKLFQPLLAK